jgi:hypothetical protein
MASQDEHVVEEDEGETTIYFDAEEGTFVNAAGEEIRVDVEDEEDEELDDDDEDEDEDDEEDDGGVTPGAGNTAATTAGATGAHTITSKPAALDNTREKAIADSTFLQSPNNTSCNSSAKPDYEASSHHLLAQADHEHAHKGKGTTSRSARTKEQKRKKTMESLYPLVAHSDGQDGHSPETATPRSHLRKDKSS